MKHTFLSLCIVSLALFCAFGAQAGGRQNKSTITFGRSENLQTTAAKKRDFREDIEAVNKAHESWRKAHLNTKLYACQKNGERVAELARQVAERVEIAKKSALAEAKVLEGTVSQATMGRSVEIPEALEPAKREVLRAKWKQLKSAEQRTRLLERLAGQVKRFYQNDVPKQPAFGGNCPIEYPQALRKSLHASSTYHEEADTLARKMEKLLKIVETALGENPNGQLFAAGH